MIEALMSEGRDLLIIFALLGGLLIGGRWLAQYMSDRQDSPQDRQDSPQDRH